MKKLLLAIILFITHAAHAESGIVSICEEVRSYVPPALAGRPHVLKTDSSDLVFWPFYVAQMELNPWEMVCHEVCILKKNDRWFMNRKVYIIKSLKHFKVGENKGC